MQLINLNKEKKKEVKFSKPGDYIIFFYNVSGKFTFDLAASGINLDIFGLFIGKNAKEFSLETVQNHKYPASTSNLLIKGVFRDKSKFNYKGLIRIEKKAQKSHAYQKNQNLILSPDVFVESKPYLEILANDVFCTHGSTTGKLNEEEIFYLKSRGFSEKAATSLLIDGFIQDLFAKIKEKKGDFKFDYTDA